jgi:dUTP pyrophosphatase
MNIPVGWVGLIKPRSGWSANFAIDTMAGVIDSDYRGEVQVILTRHEGDEDTHHYIETDVDGKGERIAQIIIVPHLTDSEEVDELDDTVRGKNGFGSTGVK